VTNTVSETVSDETLNCIISIESNGRLDARPIDRTGKVLSSALGLGQFLKATWLGVVRKHRPDLFHGRSDVQVLALRTDGHICIELLARFTEDNQRAIGMDCTGGDLYLAHFLGTGDARDFYRAPPDTPANKLVSQDVIKANPTIFIVNGEMQTAGQIRAWAARKMRSKLGGPNWIAKYYGEPVQADEPEETAEDIPDPQDAPATEPPAPTAVVPVDAPPVVVEKKIEESAVRDAETSPSWIKRKWKSVTGTIGGFLGMGTGFVFDWRLMAVVIGALFIVFLFMIWFMGPGNVREWIRKQVS
jgi:hypothetical protein